MKSFRWRSMLWQSSDLCVVIFKWLSQSNPEPCCGGWQGGISSSRGVCLHSLTLVKCPSVWTPRVPLEFCPAICSDSSPSRLSPVATSPLSRGIPSHHSLNIYLMLVKYRQFAKQPIQDRSHQRAAEKNDGWPRLRIYDCHKRNTKESRKWLLTETVWNATIFTTNVWCCPECLFSVI